MEKIKVIIKRPDEKYGHMTNISPSLKNLQKIVEGYVEIVTILEDKGLVMICNEEGKIRKLPRNFIMGKPPFHDMIVGTVILCGADGDGLTDIPIGFDTWKFMINRWNRWLIWEN